MPPAQLKPPDQGVETADGQGDTAQQHAHDSRATSSGKEPEDAEWQPDDGQQQCPDGEKTGRQREHPEHQCGQGRCSGSRRIVQQQRPSGALSELWDQGWRRGFMGRAPGRWHVLTAFRRLARQGSWDLSCRHLPRSGHRTRDGHGADGRQVRLAVVAGHFRAATPAAIDGAEQLLATIGTPYGHRMSFPCRVCLWSSNAVL
jgi:hypothetical protein